MDSQVIKMWQFRFERIRVVIRWAKKCPWSRRQKDRELAFTEWVKNREPSEGTRNPRGSITPHVEMSSAESPNRWTVQGPQGILARWMAESPYRAAISGHSVRLHSDTWRKHWNQQAWDRSPALPSGIWLRARLTPEPWLSSVRRGMG